MSRTDPSRDTRRRGPSPWWLVAALFVFVLATVAAVTGVAQYRESSRPVGEGELFSDEAEVASLVVGDRIGTGWALADALRSARNQLNVEAVAAVSSGHVVAATSSTLEELTVNPLLAGANERQRFFAVAASPEVAIAIDGVVEWNGDEILYLVHQPEAHGAPALLLYYDFDELLLRRARAVQIQPWTFQLLVAAVAMGTVGVLLVLGRARAWSRYRRMELESDLLRQHAAELEATNTELEAARTEAERALALAEETNRIRSEFVLMINHELRTPLASVVTGAELLQVDDGLTKEDRARLVDDMVADGNRLHGMISQMLAVARIENRGFEFDLRRVPLLQLCSDIEAAHPKLTVDHLGTPDEVLATVAVRTDPQTVAQLVASLADNALTHGASTVRLECSVDLGFEPLLASGVSPEEAVYFTVIDDGPGIDPEFLPRIFEKFEKKSFSSGTGLGLYLADLMVNALEGSLSVTTSTSGTCIAVAVPRLQATAGLEVVA